MGLPALADCDVVGKGTGPELLAPQSMGRGGASRHDGSWEDWMRTSYWWRSSLCAPGGNYTYYDDFFEGEKDFGVLVEEVGKPVMHIHGNDCYLHTGTRAMEPLSGAKDCAGNSLDKERKRSSPKVKIDVQQRSVRISRQ